MADRIGVPRLPQHLVPIAAAVAIAVAGYVLVALRFGGTLREATIVVQNSEQARQQIPAEVDRLVQSSLKTHLAEIEDAGSSIEGIRASTESLSRDVNGRLSTMNTEIIALRQAVQRAESAATQAKREAEAAKLALAQRPAAGGGAVDPSSRPVAATTPVDGGPVIATTDAGAPVVLAPPPGTVFSSVGDFRLDLIRARTGSNGIVLEATVTKERGGDGVLRLVIPDRRYASRVVLADGVELRDGSMTIAGRRASSSKRDHVFDLIEGVPIRVDIIFDGDFQAPVLCRRIELQAFAGSSGEDGMMFRFDDVLVAER
ncbi:MAG: hypothetical protein ACTS3F_02605 [Phycisphaerales bacterium]